ncbi:MAG: MopE-related protein, partial [Pseudomonadota bacterium]
ASLTALQSLDADPRSDIVVGSYLADANGTDSGSASVFNQDCVWLFDLLDPDGQPNDHFGIDVAGMDDVNGDFTPDIAVSAWLDDVDGVVDAGSVLVFSGIDGSLLWKSSDSLAAMSDQFGTSIAKIGDLDGDLIGELAVGVPGADTSNGVDAGRVVILSGLDGSVLWRLEDPQGMPGDQFGSFVGDAGDFNLDGDTNIAVGAPFSDEQAADGGLILVLSATDGTVLHRFTDSQGGSGDLFGCALDVGFDQSGDGRPDLIGSACQASTSAGANVGRAIVFSGFDGTEIDRREDPNGAQFDRMGEVLSMPIGVLGGSASADPSQVAGAGKVVVLSVGTDCDSDGFIAAEGDCDDTNALTAPGFPERCDDVDNDCDGEIDEDLQSFPEVCNGIDDNCNGQVDEFPPTSCSVGGGIACGGVNQCSGEFFVCAPFSEIGETVSMPDRTTLAWIGPFGGGTSYNVYRSDSQPWNGLM